ncbi:hypothetical protein FZC76_21745 [Sutcliffiella horikoshii]|uniref:Uncharacterized protein n=1 Tax=Sutcliffiella horikoshii TaxID=79883 RepID=A0A5D4SA22_9BACI|nr:hypothetical protein [Sutcliffiella horikoshii]TYS60497.1 hypothetical protein FZC76_21745 [Sutcliffiella horikoshii]
MSKRWMVLDTASGDEVFHDSLEKAKKDYNDAIIDIKESKYVGKTTVYLFEVKEQTDLTFYPED